MRIAFALALVACSSSATPSPDPTSPAPAPTALAPSPPTPPPEAPLAAPTPVACGRFAIRPPENARWVELRPCVDRSLDFDLPAFVGATGGASLGFLVLDRCIFMVHSIDTGLPEHGEAPFEVTEARPIEVPGRRAFRGSRPGMMLEELAWGGNDSGTSLVVEVSMPTWNRGCPSCDQNPSVCGPLGERVADAFARSIEEVTPPVPQEHIVAVTLSSDGERISLTLPPGYYVRALGGRSDLYETRYAVGPFPPDLNAPHLIITSFIGGPARTGRTFFRADVGGRARAFVADDDIGCASYFTSGSTRNPVGTIFSVCPTGNDPQTTEIHELTAAPPLPAELRSVLASATAFRGSTPPR